MDILVILYTNVESQRKDIFDHDNLDIPNYVYASEKL